ncbi:MAG: SRPBCC family protein [Anaerolineales bacterium]
MFEFNNSVKIERPVSEVFAVATDLTKLPKWNYFVQSVIPTGGTPGQAGATYHQVRKSDEQDLIVIEVDENRSFVVETIPPSKPELRRSMKFKVEGEITVVEDQWQLELGVPKLLEPLAGAKVKGAVADNLRKLKSLIETGAATLQDGRTTTL